MKKWCLGFVLAALPAALYADTTVETPGLLPTAVARLIIDQDPEVTNARAGKAVAKEDAAIAKNSPYEWSAKFTRQKRELEAGEEYREWNASLDRTFRMPTKLGADKRISQALLDQGDAQYGEAIHETAKELLNTWLDWIAAEQAYNLAQANQQSSRDNFGIVQKQFKAGDAAKLDVSLAQGELAEQERLFSDAKIQATVAWAKLHSRFPGLSREYANLPAAVPVDMPESYWRERIKSQSDELKIAEAEYRGAKAGGERARADRLPDPTVGIFKGSEFAGRERVVGISISMPIPGSTRSAKARKAVQEAEMAHGDWLLVQREIETNIATSVATTNGSYESWQLAESSSSALSENARLMQRAYTLGEADLSTLLLARRQAHAASLSALEAKVAAARAYYSLLIDAHLVWDLDHDD